MRFLFSITQLYIKPPQASTLSLSSLILFDMADTSEGRRRGFGKRATATGDTVALPVTTPTPCGACKFLRRKCMSGCIFAPHFGSDQGSARFAAVHKVFGASNVSKLLLHIPVGRRNDAVVTISYEAQARLSDPVYGCVSTILALQQQVASLQAELAMVHTQLLNSRLAAANAFQSTHHYQHQHQQNHNIAVLQPAYSNNSSSSHHLLNTNTTSNFNSNFDLVSGETGARLPTVTSLFRSHDRPKGKRKMRTRVGIRWRLLIRYFVRDR